MAKITAKKVIYNVKQKYVEATGDTSKITYGNIDDKVGELVKPVGDLEITENGEYDVTAYETATVNVASGSVEDGSVGHPFYSFVDITIVTE